MADKSKKKSQEMISDEQRRESANNMSLGIGMTVGVLAIYLLGYGGAIMTETHNSDFITCGIELYTRLSNNQFFYMPSIQSVVGWLIGAVIGLATWWWAHNDSIRHFTTDLETSAGSGGFMDKEEFKEYSETYIEPDPEPITDVPVTLFGTLEEEAKKYSQNMIMTNEFCRPINSRTILGNNSVLVVGGAGSGKSRFFIKPNLLQMNASFVVTDPSGEMINSLGKTLIDHGYRLKVFNISDMAHSNTYNPLAYIRDEAGVNMVITCLIDNTTQGEGGGDNQFFVDAEKLLYSACIFYLKDYCHNENMKNFAGVMSLINSSAVDENNANAKSDLDKIFDKLPNNSLARKYYRAFKQAAGKTLKSIIISCVTRLQPFMTPQVVNLTSSDDLELDRMGDEKTALFIITPQADRTYAFLASMLYSQLFETLYYKGEQQLAEGGSEQMKVPIRCMMDEFANIGTVPDFPGKLATMRKYNISAAVVLQDIAQIEAMYKDNWKTLVGNCSTTLFLGSSEPNTLQYFSDRLGKKTIRTKSISDSKSRGGSSDSYQYTGREVMTADELGRMPSDECIVFTQNMRAYRDKKYMYERHPYYPQTADADKENAFEYKKLPVFDNTKQGRFKSLITAQNEAAKYRQYKTTLQSAHTVQDDGDSNLDANEFELDDETTTRLYSVMMMECESKALETYDQSISVVKLNKVPSKYLFDLAERTAFSIRKDPVMVFGGVDNKKDLIIGVGYAAKDNFDKLKAVMNNKYSKTLDAGTCKGHEYCIATVINKAYFNEYVEYINKNF